MVDSPNRRRFLQFAGTGVAASVAGCSDLNPLSAADSSDDRVTAIVEPASEDLEELEEDLMDGEIEQDEVQERLEDLSADAISSFEDLADGDDGLTIEESETIAAQTGEVGMYLLDGEAESILAALTGGDVSQLLPAQTFETILEQQQAAEAQDGEQVEVDEEDIEEADDTEGEGDDEEAADTENESDE